MYVISMLSICPHHPSELVESPLLSVVVSVAKHHLGLTAKVVCDGVNRVDTWHICHRVGDHFAVLHPNPAHLHKVSIVSTIVSQELGDYGERLCCVENKLRPRSIELVISQPPRVEITSILVANSVVSLVPKSTRGSLASLRAIGVTRMRSVSSGHAVRLPDVKFHATGSIMTSSGVLRAPSPVHAVGLAVDELEISRTLSIAVTSAERGSRLVCWELSLATVLVHLNEVQGSVESARQLGDVHVKGELPVLEVEHVIVFLIRGEKVGS